MNNADTMGLDSVLDELRDRRPVPAWKRAYWSACRGWEAVRIFPRRVRWFIQRGARGWSDSDLWSLDHYLAGWLPSALRALKERKHGTPMAMFEGLVPDDQWHNIPEAASEEASRRWEATLDQMIAGFEAWARAQEGLYESEVGPFEVYRPEGIPRDEWRARRDERFAERQKLTDRDMATFDVGMAQFVKHFGSLWD